MDATALRGENLVDAVLLAADLVPPGRVVSYGDVAALVGTSARRVGRIMATQGHRASWWRVVNASGDLVVLEQARDHWAAEGIQVRPDGRGCRITDYRAELGEWADAVELAWRARS